MSISGLSSLPRRLRNLCDTRSNPINTWTITKNMNNDIITDFGGRSVVQLSIRNCWYLRFCGLLINTKNRECQNYRSETVASCENLKKLLL